MTDAFLASPEWTALLDLLAAAAGIAIWVAAILVLYAVIAVWLYARIVARAGYSRWWAVLMLIPVVNWGLVWLFAFADWPALREPACPPAA